jgi:hypothetical protein
LKLFGTVHRETQLEVVTLLQTQAAVWLRRPFAVLHPEPPHHFTAISCGPLPLLRQTHTLVKRIQRVAALLHWLCPAASPLQSFHTLQADATTTLEAASS